MGLPAEGVDTERLAADGTPSPFRRGIRVRGPTTTPGVHPRRSIMYVSSPIAKSDGHIRLKQASRLEAWQTSLRGRLCWRSGHTNQRRQSWRCMRHTGFLLDGIVQFYSISTSASARTMLRSHRNSARFPNPQTSGILVFYAPGTSFGVTRPAHCGWIAMFCGCGIKRLRSPWCCDTDGACTPLMQPLATVAFVYQSSRERTPQEWRPTDDTTRSDAGGAQCLVRRPACL